MTTQTKRIFTLPNILSMVRIAMIPAIAALYLYGQEVASALMLVLSGVTDVVDGWYARRYNAVSDLGKALDPVADKLTQAVMLCCLASKHPALKAPLMLLVAKEAFAAFSGMVVIRRTGWVPGAVWHGKLTTLLLYATMILHAVWQDIPADVSNTTGIVCIVMMLTSMLLYAMRNFRAIREVRQGGD